MSLICETAGSLNSGFSLTAVFIVLSATTSLFSTTFSVLPDLSMPITSFKAFLKLLSIDTIPPRINYIFSKISIKLFIIPINL